MTALERLATLTPREREVLEGVVRGLTSKEIGRELGLATTTASTHRARVHAKLGTHNAIEVARFARSCGLPMFGDMTTSSSAPLAPQAAPSLGRVVLFAFDAGDGKIEERPAIVVRVFTPGNPTVNLQVLVDGANDNGLVRPDELDQANDPRRFRMMVWRTSVVPSDDSATPQPNRWRWPPRA